MQGMQSELNKNTKMNLTPASIVLSPDNGLQPLITQSRNLETFSQAKMFVAMMILKLFMLKKNQN